MQNLLYRLFRLRQGELGLVLVLGFLLLANSIALEVSDVVAVSGFLSQVETPRILIVWIVDFTLLILTTGLQSLVIDRFQRVSVIRWMIFGFALIYIVLRLMFTLGVPGWLNYTLLFLLSDQQWLFFPLVFWVLANDIFNDMTQAKRIFPVIASWGFVGQIIGLGLAAAAPSLLARLHVQSYEMLTLNAFIYLVVYMVIGIGLRNIVVRQTAKKTESIQETLSEGWGFVREVPAFRYLMLSILGIAAAIIIVEYHFLVVTDAYFAGGGFQTFYSLSRLAVTISAFAVQSLLTSRIMDKLTVKNSFFILPISMAAMIAWVLAIPTVVSATAALMISRLMKQTVDESAKKSLQSLVPEERRGRVSIFMDSYLFSGGIILGCLIAGGVTLVGQAMGISQFFYGYLAIAFLFLILAIWTLFQMRNAYDSSMLNWRLKRRQRGSSVLDKLEF